MNAILLSALWGVLMMYAGFLTKDSRKITAVAIIGILSVLAVNILELQGYLLFQIDTRGMLVHNHFGLVFNTVILFSTFIYFVLSGQDITSSSRTSTDLYALIFFILSGISVIAGFKSLLMLFIGVEIMSIPLYVLAGSDKRNLKSNEAALKYFLMGSFSTGLMLMGIAFLYGDSGSFQIDVINAGLALPTPMKAIGLVLILASMAFKVSAAPFHFWTPDVYDGTPTVFTSFMATIIKSAAFYAFLKLFDGAFGKMHAHWEILMAVVVTLTLVVGNITAVFQQSVKRMLSYSSIAQAGFMMLGIFALNVAAKQGMILYFAAYSLATLGIFAVLSKLKDHSIDALNGFAKNNPLVAFSLLICILSLAGIPLTAGFFAKYFMLLAVFAYGKLMWLLVVAVLAAAVSVYYYFRLIQAMYFKESQAGVQDMRFSSSFTWAMLLNALIILALGIHPDWLLSHL